MGHASRLVLDRLVLLPPQEDSAMRHRGHAESDQWGIEGDPERYTVRDRKHRPVGELERHGDDWTVRWQLDGWRTESRVADAMAMLQSELG